MKTRRRTKLERRRRKRTKLRAEAVVRELRGVGSPPEIPDLRWILSPLPKPKGGRGIP